MEFCPFCVRDGIGAPQNEGAEIKLLLCTFSPLPSPQVWADDSSLMPSSISLNLCSSQMEEGPFPPCKKRWDGAGRFRSVCAALVTGVGFRPSWVEGAVGGPGIGFWNNGWVLSSLFLQNWKVLEKLRRIPSCSGDVFCGLCLLVKTSASFYIRYILKCKCSK